MTRWDGGPSPAAAGAVSRTLSNAGIKRAVEIWKGAETEGFVAALKSDCVRVEYVPGLYESSNDREKIAAGLTLCERALRGKYLVERVVREVAYPGEWRDEEVLEVRPRG